MALLSLARCRRGFTLAEVATACALAGVMASLAVPGLREQQHAAGRSDAVDALTRVQVEQARHFDQHGLYADGLDALRGARSPRSPQGGYTITLERGAPERYLATATALAGGPQAGDRVCPVLTLQVRDGFAEFGPSARCWGR
jgi:type IV pilus assembly protein PilE